MEIIFISLLLFWFFDRSVDGFGFQPLTFIPKALSDCPGGEKNPVYWRGSFTKIGLNKFLLNGEVVVEEIVTGPVEVILFWKIITNLIYELF